MEENITATKRFEFSYAHHLPGYEGACVNLHGHNAILEVTVAGRNETEGAYRGMVMDFSKLKNIVNENVLRYMDHTCLNDELASISPPTAENMVRWIGDQLEDKLPKGVSLYSIRLSETEGSWVTLKL